ncbi:MAG TPA: hypothetical protein VK908_10145 [Jiangellales bacterium]|nr:hypothetical protein [Jiangellales bacterium]
MAAAASSRSGGEPEAVGHGGSVLALGRRARAWRLALAACLAVGYLAGTLVGDDHWWPLAPWRMYSTSTAPTGAVSVPVLQVQGMEDETWRDTPLRPRNIGLSRAELEGRQDVVLRDPAVLATIAATHARLDPDDPPWTGVRLVRRSTVIEDRSPTGAVRERVLAEWTVPGGGRLVDP